MYAVPPDASHRAFYGRAMRCVMGALRAGLTAMIAGLAPRARCFDPRLSWRGPFGRTKVRPILLPAKLSYHDKKASKETLPGRSPRERRAVPCAPRSTRGLADSASLRCGQRAVPTAPRKISGPDPRRPPVLGELLRGKNRPNPHFY